MLVDTIRVNFKAGHGGAGFVSFGRNRKPNGGDGGKGGDIYLEGSTSVYDLTSLKHEEEFIAENGGQGGNERKTGKNGKDIVIKVPIITTVRSAIDNTIVVQITEAGQKVKLVEGGIGGLGNYYFRRGQLATLYKHTNGRDGEELKAIIELQLQADVVFIGFPNAGKSSMLNALTNSRVKVAPYPFTTLQPHLGVTQGMMLMDLPGLIEGAAEGKGLGKRFTRHAVSGKVVAHFVSLENEDIVSAYKTMRREIEQINKDLAAKPEIILLTKVDMFTPEEVIAKKALLTEFSPNIVEVSAYIPEKVTELKQVLQNELAKLRIDLSA